MVVVLEGPQKEESSVVQFGGKGVVSNFIHCGSCVHWVHKKCRGITGKLRDDNQFVCKKYKTMETDENSDVEKVYSDVGAIDVAQEFCYLILAFEREERCWSDCKS